MRPCRLAALTILYVSAAVCVLGITPARADVDPALLVRQPNGAYAPAPLVGLPGTVAEQPCLKYNNFWCLKGTQWRGQTKVGTHRLAVFADPADAARAFAITLQAYRFKHGLSTPTQIMSRFILNPGCLKGGRSKAGCASMWKLVDRHAGRLAGALGIGPHEDTGVFVDRTRVNIERARILFREVAHIEIGTTLRVRDSVTDEGLTRAGISW
jgi:hypothetical protein